MPTPRHRYTLVGFSDELDWRALDFVEPIPPNRICTACGLVTRVTAFLPCLHVFCKKCYEQCCHDDGHCCPLDNHLVVEEDVEWREFPVMNLLKRKVKCWNEDRGCNIVLPASELSQHFCKDCDHHSICCPRCSIVVHCSSVFAHMQSECRDHVMSVASGNPQTKTTGEKALMMALNADIGEMKVRLDQLTQENNVQSNHLNDISNCMITMKEALLEISGRINISVASSSEAIQETLNDHGERLQQLAGTIMNSQETFKNALEDTKRSVEQVQENTRDTLKADFRELFSDEMNALKKTLQKELECATRTICSDCAETVSRIVGEKVSEKQINSSAINTEKILALNTIHVKRHEFVVEGFKAIKERAFSTGDSIYENKKVYIAGYYLWPGLHFKKVGQHVYLHPRIQLHKGMIDDVLQWPFKEKVRLTIKHPSQNKDCTKEVIPRYHPEYYARPDKASNAGAYLKGVSFCLDYLEREEYVADDKLRVVWELVPEN
ncbi:TNF receptor-associated factor 6-like [Rhipicephalus sanguineus]|uniref:TNF receptor-associated factor 6-like n=1 Tax=Rhipicephalus sanguineus TaxID=34632 RepID=UPI001892D7C5|nr:TNF receptor-associated factor 6-like [Rhipicephalus sanguineus]